MQLSEHPSLMQLQYLRSSLIRFTEPEGLVLALVKVKVRHSSGFLLSSRLCLFVTGSFSFSAPVPDRLKVAPVSVCFYLRSSLRVVIAVTGLRRRR